MKVYSISSLEQLERAADLVKWQSDQTKVMNYIAYWKRRKVMDPDNALPSLTLEIGRRAQIFRHDGGKKQLATLYVIPARDFAREELTEI